MSEVSGQAELAEIRERLTKLESSRDGSFGRGLVWFAGFVIVSFVLLSAVAVWTNQANRTAARRMMVGQTMTVGSLEGRCELDGDRIYATAPDRFVMLKDYVQACMRSYGYNFSPREKVCAAAEPGSQALTPGCYLKDPAAWPKAK